MALRRRPKHPNVARTPEAAAEANRQWAVTLAELKASRCDGPGHTAPPGMTHTEWVAFYEETRERLGVEGPLPEPRPLVLDPEHLDRWLAEAKARHGREAHKAAVIAAFNERAGGMATKRKRKPMGDVAVGFRGTAADAVAAGNEDAPARRASRRKDLEKVMYRLRPEQIAALRAESYRRAQKTGSGRPDASEVLRQILDGDLDPAKVMGR